jgi:glycosyltransferase involved in cell wall biosynthesis
MLSYTVVIPAYNAADTICQALESVLAQTAPAREVIVVDDGSTDGTSRAIGQVGGPVTVISQSNQGPGAATTVGLKRVSTPFVATLDADDLWLPDKIARQARCFRDYPDVAGVFSLAQLFRDGATPVDRELGAVQRLWTRTTMFYRSDAARAVGDLVDLPGRLGETIDWLARARDLGQRHVMVDEVLALRRVRPGSLSYRPDTTSSRGYLEMARAAIARKRMKTSTEAQ